MTKNEVMEGIAPYKGEMARLREFLSDWRSEHEFDAEFRQAFGHFPMQGFTGNTLMLGGMNPHGSWAFYLDLLQHMIYADLVEQEERDGVIFYRVPRVAPVAIPA